MSVERPDFQPKEDTESTLDRLARLMLNKLEVDPQLEINPDERAYTLGFKIPRPGKTSTFSILSLEDAAQFSKQHIDAHPEDEHITGILKSSLAIGETLKENPSDEALARRLGRAMFEHRFGKD